MKDILEEIVASKRKELTMQKEQLPPSELYSRVEAVMEERERPLVLRSMRKALSESQSGIIAEFKRKSPSKGWIHESIMPEQVIPFYAEGGASALSILTDEPFFGGKLDFISRMRPLVEIPILRKDFIVDEYQIFQARLAGADAVLLIAADLSVSECRSLLELAHELKLEVLLEIHEEKELDYCSLEADMIGVNNRNLGTFNVNIANSVNLVSKLPCGKILVSESGISAPEKVRELRGIGYKGFLIGETFMKTKNPGNELKKFIKSVVS